MGQRGVLPDGAASLVPAGYRRRCHVLWTIAVILIVLWLLGLLTSFTMHGFIHVLIVLAIIAVLIRIIQGRRVL
jgi:hypothetical protein